MAITLTPFSKSFGATVDTLADIWDIGESKPETFVQFKMDPLVLSCSQYRLSNPKSEDYNPAAAFTSLGNNPDYLYDKVMKEDFDLAEKIRKYYWGKLAFAKLRGSQMSKFRQDLTEFVNIKWDETVNISEKFFGMLYKLPYFYHHDLILTTEVFDSEYQEIVNHKRSKDEVRLTYIRSLDEYQKRNPSIKYWFRDEYDNRFCVPVEKSNSLIQAWEQFIKNPIIIKGSYVERAYDTLHFYRVNPGWKIVG